MKHAQPKEVRRLVAMSVVLLVTAACSAASAGGSPTKGPSSSLSSTQSSAPGVTIFQITPIGRDEPIFTAKAPSPAWSQFKGFGVTNDFATLGMAVWDVGTVPRNPCHPIGHFYNPGPTVDDLVAALEKQPMRNATNATAVTLAGFHGRHLEWSVPKDMVVTGDGDFAGCDIESDGHRNFVSWHSVSGGGERWQQEAGQVDMLWILDVNGHRVVVDANYGLRTTKVERDELARMVKSLQLASQ
jgi:hypothetical protein